MKMKSEMKVVMCILALVFFVNGFVEATVIDIPVFRDGVMDSGVPDNTVWNYQANPRLGMDSGGRAYRAWLMFALDAIPEGQTIESAEVRIVLSQRIAAHVDCVDVTNPATMGEGSVTWNNQPALDDTLQSHVWLAPADWVLKFNSQALTDSVQTYYEGGGGYWGCVTIEDTAGYALWYAREETVNATPILRVEYIPEPASILILAGGSIFAALRRRSKKLK